MGFAADSLGVALVEDGGLLCVSDEERGAGAVQFGMIPCVPRPMDDGMQPVRLLAPDGSNKENWRNLWVRATLLILVVKMSLTSAETGVQHLVFVSNIHKTELVHITPITSQSCPHVDERRPPLWCGRCLSQLLDRPIERVCDCVRIDGLVRHQLLVEPLRQVRAVGVAHHPVFVVSSLSMR
jgi:hypothetical protein